jgi:hypothetical protein
MSNNLTRRFGSEISLGLWSDPLSERRNDFDGAQAGFEAAIAHTKSIVDAIGGSNSGADASLDAVWDAALEIAAHLVETDARGVRHGDNVDITRKIRALKRQR